MDRLRKNGRFVSMGRTVRSNCLYCGKEIIDSKSANRRFCSNSHARKHRFKDRTKHGRWRGKRIIIECPICKKRVEKKSYLLKYHKNLFCSCRCQAIWKCKHQKRKKTDIELRMKNILIENNFRFKEQVVFPKICIADFFLPEYKLAIFCDGEYWHNYPIGKRRDKEQVEKLNKIGIKAIRLWGKQIKEKDPIKYLEQFLK